MFNIINAVPSALRSQNFWQLIKDLLEANVHGVQCMKLPGKEELSRFASATVVGAMRVSATSGRIQGPMLN